MNRSVLSFAALTLAAALVASPASAQIVKPVAFGIAGGATMPMGDNSDVVKMGYHAQGIVTFSLPAMPVAIRADVSYDRHSWKNDVEGNFNTIAATVNGQYTLPGVAIRPYLLAGVGMYRAGGELAGAELEATTDLGLNGGAGVRFNLGGLSSFAEARLHNVFSEGEATRWVPITFGIMF
jgi:outer membrane protein with beta-barrel domain